MSATIIRNHEKTPLVTNSTFKIPPIDVTLTNFTIQETQEDNDDERSQNTPAPFSEAPCSTYGHNRKLSESASLKTKRAKQKLVIASTLCLFFLVAECVGGVMANSLAIITDAAHLLSDFASFLISLLAIWFATRPSTSKLSYGWHREVMGALLSVLIIWVLTGVLVYEAIKRVINGNHKVNANIMLIIAGVGVGVNILMGLVLGHNHSHGASSTGSHGHSHGKRKLSSTPSVKKHAEDENVNVQAAFVHVIGDLLQSLGVLVAAIIIKFKPNWSIADPICTFVFSVIVLFTTITILRDALLVLMEGTPKGIDLDEIKERMRKINGVTAIHDLHVWSLTVGTLALSAHLDIVLFLCLLLQKTKMNRKEFFLKQLNLLTLSIIFHIQQFRSKNLTKYVTRKM
ncbi:zinc transporter 2-like isoform X2 [Xenia sp. Carnegie-2017]|uniref:zinc transporter 2-like isoform X2 n=1 Tax=Xenia sp. Carnegie-2017 TaxID=2897299 RepID=UPI001F049D1E|nr:zinc transporter 2-like isoform X2 [Xenia sp. Carnegie-2017]